MSAAMQIPGRTPLRPTKVRLTAAAAAVTVAGCLAAVGASPLGVLVSAVAGLLVWLAAVDVEYRLVPNRLVVPATAVVLAVSAAIAPGEAPERLLASLGAAALLLPVALARPAALGMGDIKLVALVGAACGASVLVALALGFAALGATGLLLAARTGRSAFRRQLPLVPYLAAATVVVLVTGA